MVRTLFAYVIKRDTKSGSVGRSSHSQHTRRSLRPFLVPPSVERRFTPQVKQAVHPALYDKGGRHLRSTRGREAS